MFGIIADDFTGASDIASFLVENGLKTVQMNGVPSEPLKDKVDAIVISLKSRSNPVNEAVQQSLDALDWLKKQNCQKFYFKYCSTFDSSEKGNIGPVTDALLNALGEDFTVICPALPINGRTIFNGYLFVGNKLLNESGMQNHPITPMKDANLVRLMDAQSKGKTGLVDYVTLNKGVEQIIECFSELKQQGFRYAVVDSIDNSQLSILANAVKDLKLVTGGSGLAGHMAYQMSGGKPGNYAFLPTKGKTVILSGSCSLMTNQQVELYKSKASSIQLDVKQALASKEYATKLYEWVIEHINEPLAPLVYATVPVSELKDIQETFGVEETSKAIESTFAELALKLYQSGVKNFITAGGETSSIIVQKLKLAGFYIGQQIAPGVPWLKAIEHPIHLALKSGNFGRVTFFIDAQGMLK